MKKLLAFLLALVLLAGCAADTQKEESIAEKPIEEEIAAESAEATVEPAYLGTFSAQTLTGEILDQRFFANADLTVINVWATFCGPCKREMPILGALDKELENVQVLGIVIDVINQNAEPDKGQVALALELLAAYGCDYPNLILNQSLANLGFARPRSVPATLFVDKDGNLVGTGFYGILDEEKWRNTIHERLELVQQ